MVINFIKTGKYKYYIYFTPSFSFFTLSVPLFPFILQVSWPTLVHNVTHVSIYSLGSTSETKHPAAEGPDPRRSEKLETSCRVGKIQDTCTDTHRNLMWGQSLTLHFFWCIFLHCSVLWSCCLSFLFFPIVPLLYLS